MVFLAFLGLFLGLQGEAKLREMRDEDHLKLNAQNRPNILVIIVDALRADHLSSYGYGRSTTPNLDAISAEGVRFENAIATSSWSLPSHTSILTGRYPHEHGAETLTQSFDGRFPTLPSIFEMRDTVQVHFQVIPRILLQLSVWAEASSTSNTRLVL